MVVDAELRKVRQVLEVLEKAQRLGEPVPPAMLSRCRFRLLTLELAVRVAELERRQQCAGR